VGENSIIRSVITSATRVTVGMQKCISVFKQKIEFSKEPGSLSRLGL